MRKLYEFNHWVNERRAWTAPVFALVIMGPFVVGMIYALTRPSLEEARSGLFIAFFGVPVGFLLMALKAFLDFAGPDR